MIDISSRFGIADSIISDIRALPPQRLWPLLVCTYLSSDHGKKRVKSLCLSVDVLVFGLFDLSAKRWERSMDSRVWNQIFRSGDYGSFIDSLVTCSESDASSQSFRTNDCSPLGINRDPSPGRYHQPPGSSNRSSRTSTPEMQIVLVNVIIGTWIFDLHQIICHLSFSFTII